MFPHERSLVKAYQNRPFAIVGVNSDSDLKEVKEKNAKQNITWRSFCDKSGGPIAKAWRIRGWPTLYYIDHEGVIQHINERGEKKMEEIIEAMVVKAEAAQKG